MRAIVLHFLAGLALLSLAGGAAAAGWVPDSSRSDELPVSVRDNPSSYRPSYAVFIGFHPMPTGSSGGYRSGK